MRGIHLKVGYRYEPPLSRGVSWGAFGGHGPPRVFTKKEEKGKGKKREKRKKRKKRNRKRKEGTKKKKR